MDAFEKWYYSEDTEGYFNKPQNYAICKEAWQEAAKQKDAEVWNLKTTIENLELQVASFTDNRVDLVAKERGRIVGVLRKQADKEEKRGKELFSENHREKAREYRRAAEFIEKDSK